MHVRTISRGLTTFIAAAALALVGATTPAQATVTNATMTLSPTVKTVTHGSSVKLTISVNTNGHAVNAVQFWLTFPDSRLDCTAITNGTTWPNVSAKLCDSTRGAFAVGSNAGTSFTGTAKVATITLKTTSVRGSAAISFDRSRSLVVDASSNTDVLGSTNTCTIKVS
jgi:hypothetical protein